MSQPHDPEAAPDAGPGAPVPSLDDDELGGLVRASAERWTMPPVRLDEAGWRERVRTPRARRIAALRGWTSLLGRAAAASIALTLGAALLGVYLTRPNGPAAQSQGPRGTNTVVGTPRPSRSGAAPSQLPKLLVEGDVPTPSQLIVSVESSFALVDLGTGTIGQALASGQYGTVLRRGPDGSIYCLCLSGDATLRGSFSHMTVTLSRYVDGVSTGARPVGDYRGEPTPGDAADPDQPQSVAIRVSFGSDPSIAFVGWTVHAHPLWKSGLAVVDVSTGDVIQRIDLPETADGTETSRTGADAPRVIGSAGDGRVAIARPWYTWSPPASQTATYDFGADAFVADFDGRRLSNVARLTVASQCGDQVVTSGTVASGNWWLGCAGDDFQQTVVRRVSPDDRVLGDTQVSTVLDTGEFTGTSTVGRDGTALFLWNPMSLVLTRVDLETGKVSTGEGQKTASADGPLAALGRWLAPTAAAKVLLSSGIALSPDGTRVYAVGISGGTTGSEFAGSAGVFVFDAASLGQVDHWNPTADFVSIAVSADGQFVYAAGSPGASADGQQTSQPASITVFDASNGSVRLLAGQLGQGFILFPSTIVR
jgi:hypothetical protein